MNKPTIELLREMAQLTAVTGQINEIQIQNLKSFPLVFFNEVKEVKVDYNLSPIDLGDSETLLSYSQAYVKYYLQLDESQNDNLNNRFLALDNSVKTVFWHDITVELYLNGKKYGLSE